MNRPVYRCVLNRYRETETATYPLTRSREGEPDVAPLKTICRSLRPLRLYTRQRCFPLQIRYIPFLPHPVGRDVHDSGALAERDRQFGGSDDDEGGGIPTTPKPVQNGK